MGHDHLWRTEDLKPNFGRHLEGYGWVIACFGEVWLILGCAERYYDISVDHLTLPFSSRIPSPGTALWADKTIFC